MRINDMANSAVTVADLEIVLSYRTEGNPQQSINRTAQALNKIKSESQKSEKSVNKLFESLKRIAFYRLIRTAIKAVVSAIKEGISNLEAWSRLNDGKFAKSMDNLRDSLSMLKNSLAVALAPIIQYVIIPLIQAVSWVITKVCNGISALNALLKGETSYLAAVYTNTNDANDAANKYKRTLLGFDELNKLNGDTSDTSAIGSMFEEKKFEDGTFKNIFVDLKKQAGDFATAVDLATYKVFDLKEQLATQKSTNMFDLGINAGAVYSGLDAIQAYIDEETGSYVAPKIAISVETETAIQQIKDFCDALGEQFTNIGEATSNAASNIKTWVSTTAEDIKNWALNTAGNVLIGARNIADSVYKGLSNAASNVVAFVNSTAQSIAEWGTNIVANIGATMSAFIDNVVEGLKTAWENFCSFFKATGEKVSGWFSENKKTIVTTVALTALAVGAVALAPFTGGASLAGLAAFADGGYPEQGSIFLAGETGDPEFVGNVGGRTAVYNSDQLAGSLAVANQDVVNAIYQAVSSINNAIANQPVPSIKIGDREIYKASERGKTISGRSLIQGV